jgi:formate hydrogenlyase subunit 3/multisubunit Na+/H+ antiporter MnhD subunit
LSAPLIWIFAPIVFAILLWFIANERLVTWLGIGFILILILSAWLLPIETPISIGTWSFKIASSMTILGRYLNIPSTHISILILFYSSGFLWFICSTIAGSSHKLIPIGMVIIALLISSLAVEPFLYAALLIEMAVLISIPFLQTAHQIPGRGIMRYLAFQTLAMPFILFSGWLLTGITTNAEEISLANQVATFLGLGFVFLLAIFPFNTWIPLLAEETRPLSMVFILWFFTTTGLLFGLYFLDTFTWLRESNNLIMVIRISGFIMIVSGGLWAAFQKNLKRILAYAIIMETGYSLLAISLKGSIGISLFFGLLIPRMLGLFLWALALSILTDHNPAVQFSSIRGLGRNFPFVSSAIILSQFSLVGLPLFAGFPTHQALWEQMGILSTSGAMWYFIASIGMVMAGLRTLTVMVIPSETDEFSSHENWSQRILLSIGIILLIFMGIFPQIMASFLSQLPSIFIHLIK